MSCQPRTRTCRIAPLQETATAEGLVAWTSPTSLARFGKPSAKSILIGNDTGDLEWDNYENAFQNVEFKIGVQFKTGSYQLASTDTGTMLIFNSAVGVTLTVPSDSVGSFAVGESVLVCQYGYGVVNVVGATGVSILGSDGANKTKTQYSVATLTKVDNEKWLLSGDIIP